MNKREYLLQQIKRTRRELREIERTEIGKLMYDLRQTFGTASSGYAVGKQVIAFLKYCKAHGIANMAKLGLVHGHHCVVCGEPLEAQRRSKKTCSNRCRLRLSRSRRSKSTL